ncbi:MAG: Lrp/AsnC family transcriptional regulator [Pseudomonadota bacterium]
MHDLDQIDLYLLSVLQTDARITLASIAERVGLSLSACQRRIRRLESENVIEGYGAWVNPARLGLEVVAFVRIELEKQGTTERAAFEAAVLALPLVLECHLLAGHGAYLLRVASNDLAEFEATVAPQLAALPYAGRITAEFSGGVVKRWKGWEV